MYRFSRAYYFRHIPEYRHSCPSCGAKIKANSKWEWLGNSVYAIPCGLLISAAIFGKLPWAHTISIVTLLFSLAYVFYPYCTKYDLVEKRKAVEQSPPGDVLKAAPEE